MDLLTPSPVPNHNATKYTSWLNLCRRTKSDVRLVITVSADLQGPISI